MARPSPLLLVALLALGTVNAHALPSVPEIAALLKYPPPRGRADDFRVRTSAALALGATGSDDAVDPLCSGLDDPIDVVRAAVAVALKRLGRLRTKTLACLRARERVESVESVKLQVSRAMKSIEAQASAGPSAPTTPPVSTPPLVSNAKIYVALSTVTNRTSRDGVEVQRAVLDAMRAKLAELGTYQLAPDGESADNAKAVLLRRGLVGYYLAIAVEPFEQTAVGLRVTVRVAVATYPGRDLRAPISTSGTLPGAKAGDVSSENQLLAAVASNGVVLFDRTFHK